MTNTPCIKTVYSFFISLWCKALMCFFFISWVVVASPSVLASGINWMKEISALFIDHVVYWILVIVVYSPKKRKELFFDFRPVLVC